MNKMTLFKIVLASQILWIVDFFVDFPKYYSIINIYIYLALLIFVIVNNARINRNKTS